MQEIKKKANLNIFAMILVPVARVSQLGDMLVRNFVSITTSLFLLKEICSCKHNFFPVAGILPMLLLFSILCLGGISRTIVFCDCILSFD